MGYNWIIAEAIFSEETKGILKKAKLADIVIHNTDRNLGGILYVEGVPVFIDTERAFGENRNDPGHTPYFYSFYRGGNFGIEEVIGGKSQVNALGFFSEPFYYRKVNSLDDPDVIKMASLMASLSEKDIYEIVEEVYRQFRAFGIQFAGKFEEERILKGLIEATNKIGGIFGVPSNPPSSPEEMCI